MRPGRSWVAWWKSVRTFRIPAGDSSDEDCTCGSDTVNTLRNGSGAPAAGLGINGDFYIDTDADTIYGPKTAGAWGSPTSLIGPQGDPGDDATASGSTGDIQTAGIGGVFSTVGQWTSPSSGRLNATSSGYLSYGTTGDTLPAPGSTSGGLIRLGSSVGTGGLPWGILQWYAPGAAAHYNLLTVQDNGSGTPATFTIGSRYNGAGQWLNTVINGDTISLTGDDGGGTFILAGTQQTDANRQGALFSSRVAIGTVGGGNDATFGGSAAGPMLKLHKIVTAPTGNPTGAVSPAVWIYFEDAGSDTVKIHFPSGNVCAIPDFNGTLPTTGGSAPTGTGFRHVTSGAEDAASKLVENADVHTSAAIAGTKIAPDFGAQNVVTTGYGAFGGSTLPSTGTVRLPSGSTIKYVVGGTDRPFVELTSLAEIIFGDFTSAVAILNRVGSGGVIYNQVNSTNLWTIGESGIQAFSSSFAFGGGVGVIGITNRTTAPTTNPSGGGILYAESGAGKWRGSGGTVTTFGPAEPHCPRCGTDVGVSESENDLFGEELVHCHACELRTGNGVVRHVADFFERRKVA